MDETRENEIIEETNENETNENQNNDSENKIEMTEDELNTRIQSETDKVRTKYSKKVKELEAKIKELTPVEKTEAELDFEKRLANLEEKERKMNLNEALTGKGISTEIGDYLKSDVDIEAFSKIYEKMINSEVSKRVQTNGYKPSGHKTGEEITKEDFEKMEYAEKAKLFESNPDLYKYLAG